MPYKVCKCHVKTKYFDGQSNDKGKYMPTFLFIHSPSILVNILGIQHRHQMNHKLSVTPISRHVTHVYLKLNVEAFIIPIINKYLKLQYVTLNNFEFNSS